MTICLASSFELLLLLPRIPFFHCGRVHFGDLA